MKFPIEVLPLKEYLEIIGNSWESIEVNYVPLEQHLEIGKLMWKIIHGDDVTITINEIQTEVI